MLQSLVTSSLSTYRRWTGERLPMVVSFQSTAAASSDGKGLCRQR